MHQLLARFKKLFTRFGFRRKADNNLLQPYFY